jgi:hypothetical protein
LRDLSEDAAVDAEEGGGGGCGRLGLSMTMAGLAEESGVLGEESGGEIGIWGVMNGYLDRRGDRLFSSGANQKRRTAVVVAVCLSGYQHPRPRARCTPTAGCAQRFTRSPILLVDALQNPSW